MKRPIASSAAAAAGPRNLEMVVAPPDNGVNCKRTPAYPPMPTLFRLLVTLSIFAGLVYGAMFALATYVQPNKGEMTVRIPPEKLNRPGS